MAMPNSALLFIASFLVATTSVANCILLGTTNITQVQVIATGLTCSNPSPLLLQPALSNATASLTCDGGRTVINATLTDASGSFIITGTVNNTITGRLDFPLICRVLIAVPTNCIIPGLFQTVTQLRSGILVAIQVVNNLVGGQTLVVIASAFVAVIN